MASEPLPEKQLPRKADRKSYEATVQFRAGTRRANVTVRNVSPLGARVSGVFLVREGEHFWLKLQAIEAIEARVVWVRDFEFGCEFIRPINPVIFEAVTH